MVKLIIFFVYIILVPNNQIKGIIYLISGFEMVFNNINYLQKIHLIQHSSDHTTAQRTLHFCRLMKKQLSFLLTAK